ncbi:MAG: F0F1 ATP synthase subunit A [Mycoplasmatales bacterium]
MSIMAPQTVTMLLTFGFLILALFFMTRYIKKSNPLKITSNKQNLIELFFEFFEGIVEDIVGKAYVKKITPLAITIFTSILITNIVGLIGLKEGAFANPMYTFTWSISMFLFWNLYGIRVIGIKSFLGNFVKPVAFMLPFELIGFLTKPLSMGIRLFGNITAGAFFMMLFWMVPEAIINMNTGVGVVLAPIFIVIGSTLSFYFSLFGPVIQALVFTYLTMVNIATLVSGEE